MMRRSAQRGSRLLALSASTKHQALNSKGYQSLASTNLPTQEQVALCSLCQKASVRIVYPPGLAGRLRTKLTYRHMYQSNEPVLHCCTDGTAGTIEAPVNAVPRGGIGLENFSRLVLSAREKGAPSNTFLLYRFLLQV